MNGFVFSFFFDWTIQNQTIVFKLVPKIFASLLKWVQQRFDFANSAYKTFAIFRKICSKFDTSLVSFCRREFTSERIDHGNIVLFDKIISYPYSNQQGELMAIYEFQPFPTSWTGLYSVEILPHIEKVKNSIKLSE